MCLDLEFIFIRTLKRFMLKLYLIKMDRNFNANATLHLFIGLKFFVAIRYWTFKVIFIYILLCLRLFTDLSWKGLPSYVMNHMKRGVSLLSYIDHKSRLRADYYWYDYLVQLYIVYNTIYLTFKNKCRRNVVKGSKRDFKDIVSNSSVISATRQVSIA